MRPKIYKSKKKENLVNIFGLISVVYAAVSLIAAIECGQTNFVKANLLIWILVPPIWFIFEYFVFFDNWQNPKAVEEFKFVESITSKAWAAVVAALVLLWSSA